MNNLGKYNTRYLVRRLKRVVELLNEGDVHMAIAKLLADISALSLLEPEKKRTRTKS
jgi:hypothetical protein